MLNGLPGASANDVAATYNFETKIALACGGQQASILTKTVYIPENNSFMDF